MTFTNNRSGVELELHWRWENNPAMFNLSFEEAWQRRINVKLDGILFSTLNPVDNILYLAMHGAKSSWARLSWLTDIDCIGSELTLNESDVITQAKKTGSQRLLLFAFSMAHELLDTTLPREIATHTKIDEKIVKLTFNGAQLNNQCRYPAVIVCWLYLFKLNSSWAYRWYFYTRVIGTTVTDIKLLPLPQQLFPVYYFLRPVLWLWRNRWNLKRIMK